jgi:hypothetical protein
MRTVVDTSGRRWYAEEIGRFGVGARAEGDYLPEPTFATRLFTADDGTRVSRQCGAGEIERLTEAELVELLEQPDPDD